MRKKILLSIALVGMCFTPVLAQDLNPGYTVASIFYEEQIDELFGQLFEHIEEEKKEELNALLTQEKNTILEEIGASYSAFFSEEELDVLIIFFQSNSGKKFLSNFDLIQVTISEQFQHWEEQIHNKNFDQIIEN